MLRYSLQRRFIPARAGNTDHRTVTASRTAVHPRSRGEHAIHGRRAPQVDGSSPLARGTRHPQSGGLDHRRFIPARAGNTRRGFYKSAPDSVHPRSRGEHPLGRLLTDIGPRFIPARAGNTRAAGRKLADLPVHPRSRGEHDGTSDDVARDAGSSPLARGTPWINCSAALTSRFIPARAGNTRLRVFPASSRSVHPRSRGEHLTDTPELTRVPGSSPLARGTRPRAPQRCSRTRFIPARAGNTSGRRGSRRRPPVHPRSRGEHCNSA